MKRFCPKCGKEGSAEKFVRGFCAECYASEHEIIIAPVELKVEHCKRCAKVLVGGHWVEQGAERSARDLEGTSARLARLGSQDSDALCEFVEKNIKIRGIAEPETEISLEPQNNGITLANISVDGKVEGSDVHVEKQVLLKPANVLCDACMKLASNYFEATIQIRFDEKPSQEQLNEKLREAEGFLRAERKQDPLAQVIGMDRARNGVDLRIGSKRAAKVTAEALVKQTHGKVKHSFTLMGVDTSGKAKRRFTFCVRF
ncbi:MAG: 60S ribosomal export protein NMD3 [Candidatus Diapherotrites archaeon]|nr:60S ribosomal export protein NMD3 [Candidatus Micrarchaeota archaeon]MBU1939241.1 60S ribosomal export protein NMD3 [Candidatus Micrarchaeota archaeon]